MNVLECHGVFASWTEEQRADLLPKRIVLEGDNGSCDCWPAAAVGALICTGWLGRLDEDEDLAAVLRHFSALYGGGVVDESEWLAETEAVVCAVLAAGGDLEAAVAGGAPEWN